MVTRVRAIQSPISLIVLSVVAGIDQVKFVPDAVEDAEGDRQTKAQNPGEVPHAFGSLVEVGVGGERANRRAAEHHLVGPGGVGEHDWQEDHGDQEHDE